MISARHQPVSESAISDGKLDPARQSESECLPSGNLDYDVIVAGGGTAGAAAAVAAARRGLRVLLVEEENCLGGVSTSGGVGWWFASLEGMGDIFQHLVDEMERYGARQGHFFNPEYLKFIWQGLAEAAGVQILFHASVIGTEATDGSIAAVRIACCSREFMAKARYFVDATGDGDLAALAGAEFMKGDPATGLTLHMTLTAWLYDTGKAVTPYLPADLTPITCDAELPGLGGGMLVDNGRIYLSSTKVVRHDSTDPFSLTAAELEARRQLMRILHYLQQAHFPTHVIGGSGAKIGIREGRRIVGDYLLQKEELLGRKEPLDFYDGVTVATCQIDFHSLTKPGASGWRQRLEPYSIPFRCLIAKGFQNLLVAGKCISTDQIVQSSCRMTPTCCAMGQAAGTAAALAVESNAKNVRDVSVQELRAVLVTDGMVLDPRRHKAFAPDDSRLDSDDASAPIP